MSRRQKKKLANYRIPKVLSLKLVFYFIMIGLIWSMASFHDKKVLFDQTMRIRDWVRDDMKENSNNRFYRWLEFEYRQLRFDLYVAVIFFAVFPRDQAFYVILVLSTSIYFDSVLNLMFSYPTNFFLFGLEDLSSHINKDNITRIYQYGFPLSQLFVQIIFDVNIFLTMFYTNKNSNLTKE